MEYYDEIPKRTKPIPGGETEEEYRRVMQQIMEGMTKENLEAALFLCKDHMPQGREVKTPLQFFKYLEDRDLVSQDNVLFVAEVLHLIRRMDLLKHIPCIKNKRHFENEYLSYTYTNFTNYRVLTIHLQDELSQRDFEKFRYQCAAHLRNKSLEECENVLMLLRKLEEQDVISNDDFEELIGILKCVENAKPLRDFQRLLDGDDSVVLPSSKQGKKAPQQAAFADRRNAQPLSMAVAQHPDYSSFQRVEPLSRQPVYATQPQQHFVPDQRVEQHSYFPPQTSPPDRYGGDTMSMPTHYHGHGHAEPIEDESYQTVPKTNRSSQKEKFRYDFNSPGVARGLSMTSDKCFSPEESTPKHLAGNSYQQTSPDGQYGRGVQFASLPPQQDRQFAEYRSQYRSMPYTPPPRYEPGHIPHSVTYPQNLHHLPQHQHYQPQNYPPGDRYTRSQPQRYQQQPSYDSMPPAFDNHYGYGEAPPYSANTPLARHTSYPSMPVPLQSPPAPEPGITGLRKDMQRLGVDDTRSSIDSDVKYILEQGDSVYSTQNKATGGGEENPPKVEAAGASQEMKELEDRRKNEEMQKLCYRMDSSPVGLCVLINNVEYEKNFNQEEFERRQNLNKNKAKRDQLQMPKAGLKNRIGSECDAAAMEKLFKSFDFVVKRHDDCDQREVMKIFEEASSADHSDYDCFVIIVLAHGEQGRFYGVDSYPCEIYDMQAKFCGDKCKTLVNKPKIFIIQACQGTRKMPAVTPPEADVDTDGPQPETLKDRSTPNKADFLFAYSTVPGYVSYRVRGEGSYFIQEIVKIFNEYYQTQDLLSMLVMVSNEMSKYEKTQVPMPANTLRKKVYFKRKEGWQEDTPTETGPSASCTAVQVSLPNSSSTSSENLGAVGGPSTSSYPSMYGNEQQETTIQQVTGEQYE